MLQLTGDSGMEELAWTYMNWYYNQMNIVYVPSNAMGRELAEKGISKEKIKLYPRGVDIQRFRPMPKEKSNTKRFIYVGRVSKEKNLHLLASAFKKLSTKYHDVVLQIVGDGPYKEEMQEILKGYKAEFTGYRQGDDLVKLYSDADLFVFPSTTDTFGNVVLEAQACGTPVIVTDLGGPMENIVPNETGIIVKGDDENALYNGMKKLLDDDRFDQMSQKGREYMDNRSFENAFLKTWHLYETSV
jgi:glycosyltransferase involved in cell wall biosynthesis